MSVCQKNCGIDYGKCLITTFDINECTKAEASCALDCLKGVKAKKQFEVKTSKDVGTCEKNCGLDFGKCLIEGGDFKTCIKSQASCALDCLKSVKSFASVKQSQDMGVCQKNFAIDYSKCLITTFDMPTCTQQEAACALDCLKSVSQTPNSLWCSLCQTVAGKAEGIIASKGCLLADAAVDTICETVGGGPLDPFSDACAIAFDAACPTFLSWIKKKIFSPIKACQFIHMC